MRSHGLGRYRPDKTKPPFAVATHTHSPALTAGDSWPCLETANKQ